MSFKAYKFLEVKHTLRSPSVLQTVACGEGCSYRLLCAVGEIRASVKCTSTDGSILYIDNPKEGTYKIKPIELISWTSL